MRSIEFSKTVMIGEIEFKVTGKYNPNNELDDPLEIDYHEVIAIILTDDEPIEVDGKPILESFEGWAILEEKLFSELKDDEELDEEDELDDDSDSSHYTDYDDKDNDY